jgi:hypothetical protein
MCGKLIANYLKKDSSSQAQKMFRYYKSSLEEF